MNSDKQNGYMNSDKQNGY